jgi:hypothetical protein
LEQFLFANLNSVSKSAFVDLTATDLEASSTGALTLQVRKAARLSWNKHNFGFASLSRLHFLPAPFFIYKQRINKVSG